MDVKSSAQCIAAEQKAQKYKAGVPVSEQADGACPVNGTGKAAAGVWCPVWSPIRRVDVERLK